MVEDLRPAARALAAPLLVACAGVPGPGTGARGARQLLVLLAPGPGWQRQGAEIAAEHGLTQAAAWTVAALDDAPGAALARRTVVVTAWDGGAPKGGFPASVAGVVAVGGRPRP